MLHDELTQSCQDPLAAARWDRRPELVQPNSLIRARGGTFLEFDMSHLLGPIERNQPDTNVPRLEVPTLTLSANIRFYRN
jgi:hypothetical protein